MDRTETKCRKFMVGATLLILLFVFPLSVNAGTVSLPQTGQVLCYDTAGETIACTGTGQDGEFQNGVAEPSPRNVNLADAILALQVMSGASTSGHPQINYADVNQDSRIGMPEAIFVLQELLGLR